LSHLDNRTHSHTIRIQDSLAMASFVVYVYPFLKYPPKFNDDYNLGKKST
jgi:hypothetical protein